MATTSKNQRTGKSGEAYSNPTMSSEELHSLSRNYSKAAKTATADTNRKKARDDATAMMNATTKKVTAVPSSVRSESSKVGSGGASPSVPYSPTGAPVNNPRPTIQPVNPGPTGYQATGIESIDNAPGINGASLTGSNYGDGTGWSGFSSRYTPGSAQTLYDNPQIIANDVLSMLGLGNNSALQGMYSDVAQNAIPLAQLLSAITGAVGDNATFNTAADYLQQMATVGGQAPDANALVQQLLNPTGLLENYLNPILPGGARATVDQQLSYLLPYFQAATQGVNPLAQRAMASALNRGALDLNTANATGQSVPGTSFVDFLRQGGYVPEFR